MRNNQIKGAVVELTLMEIAEGLRSLINNPDLSGKIKEVYNLNEAEQKAVEEARDLITNADVIRAEIAEKSKAYIDIGERIKQENLIKASNLEILENIKKGREEIAKKEAQLNKSRADLESFANTLTDKEVKLNARKEELDNIQEDINK